jgi:uncharacterized protein
MRCLGDAAPTFAIDGREISQPAQALEPEPRSGKQQLERDDLVSPYVDHGLLDLHGWARDALALALPVQLLCREDCAGLCAECGVNLNDAGPDHGHERAPDPRWAALSKLRFD